MKQTVQTIVLGLLGIALSYWITADAHGHVAIGTIGAAVSVLYVVVELIKGRQTSPETI